MYEHFLALKEEKQQKIINAAYHEFGKHGYKKTSAEQIARSAGIAKGMVFHYFGSKLGLYEYLMERVLQYMHKWYDGLMEKMKAYDFIEQYRYITKVKLQSYTENPYVYEFGTMLFMYPENLEISNVVKERYDEMMQMRTDMMGELYGGSGTEYFRKDMGKEQVRSYIAWIIDGYSQKLLGELHGKALADMDLDPYWGEFDDMLDDLKKLFYLGRS